MNINEPETIAGVSAELSAMASRLREIFMQILIATTPGGQTAGTCAYAVLLLKTMIEQYTDYIALPRGGDGLADGGYFDCTGKGHGHYWLEVRTCVGNFILDITADQFGEAPVLITDADTCSNYVPGNQALVESHLAEIAMSLPV
ncbi:hypothetical protein ABKU49_05470 [Enterobacter hormaechei]